MARENKYYIDAEELKNIVNNLPCMFYTQDAGTSYYTGNPSIDSMIDGKINRAIMAISDGMQAYHTSLMVNLSTAIDNAKKPYTQCMLCDTNGQKTIDEIENGEV